MMEPVFPPPPKITYTASFTTATLSLGLFIFISPLHRTLFAASVLSRSRHFAAGTGDTCVVKQNHFAILGKSVGQCGIPVIHCSREVHEEEQRDAPVLAEATVREANSGGLNELGRRGLVTVIAHETSIDGIYGKREPSARELSAVGGD